MLSFESRVDCIWNVVCISAATAILSKSNKIHCDQWPLTSCNIIWSLEHYQALSQPIHVHSGFSVRKVVCRRPGLSWWWVIEGCVTWGWGIFDYFGSIFGRGTFKCLTCIFKYDSIPNMSPSYVRWPQKTASERSRNSTIQCNTIETQCVPPCCKNNAAVQSHMATRNLKKRIGCFMKETVER